MSQKFPQVGLRAVFEISGFSRSYNRYQTMMRDVDRTTRRTAQSINQAGRQMSAGLASSLEELIRKSTLLQQSFAMISPEDALASSQDLERVFDSLGQGAQVNVGIFEHLAGAGVNVADALRVAAGQTAFNVEAFDRLIQNGVGVDQAFQQIVDSSSRATGSITLLGRSFSVTAVAVAAATAALRLGVRIIQDSTEAYDELGEATRRVRLQTGLLTQEASNWVVIAESAGISTGTLERGLAQFLSGVADLRRDMAEGNDLTSDFAKAIDTLNISIVDNQGNLRSTDDILTDVNRAFQGLGSGIVSTQLAVDLFGRTGRQLLPSLISQERSLSDLADQAERYGANLGAIDKTQFEELRNSQNRLKESTLGLKLEIGRGWAQARTNFNNALAEIINVVRQADAAIRAFFKTFTTVEGQSTRFSELGALYKKNLEFFLTGESAAARAAEEAGQARSNAAQDAASKIGASEAEIREEREKTLKQLDDLKTRFRRKLDDIDRDAAQKWEDILVTRQRQAMDRALQLAWRLDDLRAAYNQRLDAIEQDFADRWDDILVKRQREALERGIRLAQRYEDLARSTEQRRADTLRDFADREVEQRRDTQKRIEDVERDARRKREELERDHQRRLEAIQLKFLDTAQEAARRNDAVAVARAQRERNRELRDERRRFEDEQYDLADSLRKKREDIQRDRQEREADQRRELARALQRIEENAQRQRDAIARQTRRESEARARKEAQELEDFNKAKDEQIEAAEEWYDKQIEELEKAQRREEILRRIQQERQYADFRRNWNRRVLEARRWYELERNDLATHLNYTARQLEQAYMTWMQQAAHAAAQAARVIGAAWASEIVRYQHLRGAAGGGGLGIIGGRGISMAEGGVIQASSPTHVIMGDAGPETGIFLPGRSGGMNVNHNFGRLGVDFNGLPGGMNTQQVQAIVYQTMIGLAKSMQVPRT